MKVVPAWELLKATFYAWNEDKASRLGAALAYYTVFSIAPLLIIAIGIAGLVFGKAAAKGEIVSQIEKTIGLPAAQAIEEMLRHTHATGQSTTTTICGVVILLLGASGVFVQLQDALNTIWKVTPKPGRGFVEMVRDRFLSFMVVLSTGILLLVSLVISAALAPLGKFLTPDVLPGSTYLWQAVNNVLSLGLVTLLFALMYKVLPDARIAWSDVWIGALVTALLFTGGKYLIALYLGRSSMTSAFGAASSLVAILLWVYYSAQILLAGAEFTRVYACRHGSSIVPRENAMASPSWELTRQGASSPSVEAAVR